MCIHIIPDEVLDQNIIFRNNDSITSINVYGFMDVCVFVCVHMYMYMYLYIFMYIYIYILEVSNFYKCMYSI
jgi:hypothetical protein